MPPARLAITPYEDCLAWFKEAETSIRGLVLTCPTYSQAVALRARLNKARVRLRRMSQDQYPDDHPAYGTSFADRFLVTLNRVPLSSQCEIVISPREAGITSRAL